MKGVLFMCVANSARSQIAEGLARAILPEGIGVWSAGTRPCSVRPEAVAVMTEIGIDISAQYSKNVDVIPRDDIDTVITLCAEEVCPVFFGNVRRLHWPMSDPAAAGPSHEKRLRAFRDTRDELRKRIAELAVQAGSAKPGDEE